MSIKKKLHEFKRELILEEAGKLFIAEGYEAMKIADLAKNAGLSVGTIYNLFGSKENLYNNYVLRLIEQAIEYAEAALERCDDPLEKLREITRIKYDLASRHRLAVKESMNDPSFFLHMAADREHPLMAFYRRIADEVMVPLAQRYGCTIPPMELVFIHDGLGIGTMKYAMACGVDLPGRVDADIDTFLKVIGCVR